MSCWRCGLGVLGAVALVRIALFAVDAAAEREAPAAGAFELRAVVVIDGDTLEGYAHAGDADAWGPVKVRLWGLTRQTAMTG